MRDSRSSPGKTGALWRTLLLALSLLTGSAPAAGESDIYQELQIVTPVNDSAFWSGAGKVNIDVAAQPPLYKSLGHAVQVYLDGKPAGRGTALQLTNVDRGTHELRAEIVDRDGKALISSPTIRFTLHRPSRLLP